MTQVRYILAIIFSHVVTEVVMARQLACTCDGKTIDLNNGGATKELTGTVVCKDADSEELVHEGKYVGGVKIWNRFYHANGKVESECGINPNGNKDGLCKKWYDTGEIQEQENYVNGELRGLATYFSSTGTVESKANYIVDGKTELSFNEDGSLRHLECSSATISIEDRAFCGFNGKASKVLLFAKKDHAIRQVSFLEGKLIATENISADSGKIEETHQLAQVGRDGVEIKKFANGKPKQETRYSKDGHLNGIQREYAETGQLTREVDFDTGFMVREELYFLNGQIKRLTERKKQGTQVFVQSKVYWDNGQLQESGTYLEVKRTFNGFDWGEFWSYDEMERDGNFKAWREDGTLTSEELYAGGDQQGISKYYYDDGVHIQREASYEKGRMSREKTYGVTGKLMSHIEYFPDGSKKSHMQKAK